MLQRTLPAGFIAPCLPVPPISFVPAWPWSSLQPENGGAVGGRRRAADCYALGRLVQPDCCYGRSPLTRILGLAPMTNCAALPAAARFREAQTKRKVQNGRPVPWTPPFLGAILFNCRRPLTYSPVCRPLISHVSMRIPAAGFIPPCLPTKADTLPSGGLWVHEIKHDGFRIIARKDGAPVRLYSRPGNDFTRRFPLIVDAMARLRPRSCIIDGEAVACDDNIYPSFT